ncbi:phenylacetate--CoA ligase family protein [Zobellella maritima]|uniref:phenylacetate--CoA ligase family protein n=1 Tax=Zobellella maritima TaxID=2059725 RepID=UPI000E300AA3|nr:phenylacetate--CoA ligase family protein [Zobellella maritima]
MKEFILKYAPLLIQNMAISVYNSFLYKVRHAGKYKVLRDYYALFDRADIKLVEEEARRRLKIFLETATSDSEWYRKFKGKSLNEFPVLEKEELINNFETIRTVPDRKSIVSYTGGTTGASMKVVYTYPDMQERFALIDHFRAKYGYKLGKRTAWFSGRTLVQTKDLKRGICYRDDYINKIRFFSSFHISEDNFDIYCRAFREFKPEFIVGSPSSVYDLCKFALKRGLKAKGIVKVFFSTAETVLPHHCEVIVDVLGCEIVDQYASSEGAPFILQCKSGSMHIHPLSGFFEVVDEEMNPATEGEMLVTSFTTHGAPLIRYRIGDRIKLAPNDYKCPCGSPFPVVESIDGRSTDFIWSPENGKINLGNISNCTKNIYGLICFQVIQCHENEINVKVVCSSRFDEKEEARFLKAIKVRVGMNMVVNIERVSSIPREKSGKFRIVKNTLVLNNCS